MADGKIIQVIGPVVDAVFPAGALPNIYNAVVLDNGNMKVTMEVMEHLGNDAVRCVALSYTDGISRGMTDVDTGAPVSIPVA